MPRVIPVIHIYFKNIGSNDFHHSVQIQLRIASGTEISNVAVRFIIYRFCRYRYLAAFQFCCSELKNAIGIYVVP